VPASHLRFDQVLDIARLLERTLGRDDVDGAVVVQGTDTIEETAFCYDLLVRSTKPVVVVGAMRNAGEAGYEGPANLRDAVRCAAEPRLRDQGTLVVMAGTILPGDEATKTDTAAYGTFRAPDFGPVGRVIADEVVVARRRARRRTLPAIPDRAADGVALIMAGVATDGRLLRLAAADGAPGIVVAATGTGNTDPDVLAAATDAMASGVPVVLTTRCLAGRVTATYAFPGGGATWLRAGAIAAGHLSAPKARVALALGLGAGMAHGELRALFAG
jgi:L-asparaginase